MPKAHLQIAEIKSRVHAAIITIRSDEYDAMEASLSTAISGRTRSVDGGKNAYEYASLSTDCGDPVPVVVTRCVSQGNASAQAVASNIITDLDPAWLLLVGIAGGVPDYEFSLGDVVLATALHDFSFGGADKDGSRSFEIGGGAMHPKVEKFLQTKVGGSNRKELCTLAGFDTSAAFLSHPSVVASGKVLRDCIYGPTAFQEKVLDTIAHRFPEGARAGGIRIWPGACANGNVVLKDPALLGQWQESARQLVHIETELAGVYIAARTTGKQNYPVLAIRGLSDIVGLRRNPQWTQYACTTSAAFACAVLRSGFIDFGSQLHGGGDFPPPPAGRPGYASPAGRGGIGELVRLLSPVMGSEPERRALLTLALGHNSPILHQVELTGATEPCLVNLIGRLESYGEIATGKPALLALLDVVREHLGVDRRRDLDAFYPLVGTRSFRREQVPPNRNPDPSCPPPSGATDRQPPEFLPLVCPRPLPAYAVDPEVYLSHDMLIDAGMAWGLERGAFTGLWGGRGDVDLVGELRRVEGLLQACAPGRFMCRIWLSIDLTRDPEPEETLGKLFRGSQGTEAHGLPGLVLRAQTLDTRTLGRVQGWHGTLRERVFQGQPLALILDTTAEIAGKGWLREALERTGPKVETLVAARGWLASEAEDGLVADHSRALPRGAALRAFTGGIEKQMAKVSAELLPNALAVARHRWPVDAACASKCQGLSAEDLVKDLDDLADSDVDESMLRTIDTWWPDRIGPLVQAFAQSRRPQARRLALTLARSGPDARERQTVWLRAWAAGASRLSDADVTEALAAIRVGHADLQRDLALAALYQALRYPADGRREQLLDTIWGQIVPGPELEDVYGRCRGRNLKAAEVLANWGAERFAFALRAGVTIDVRPSDLRDLALDRQDAWWMLAALSPTADLVEALASLNRDQRAVFGLISRQEGQELANDPYQLEMITECRRGRSPRQPH